MNDKPAGWYYVGDGKLRYRDDHGWTEFRMSTTDPRAAKWPPPDPEALLRKLEAEEAPRLQVPPRKFRLFGRGRRGIQLPL